MADFYNYCNWYTVWDAKTGDLIASGTSAMVAQRLGYKSTTAFTTHYAHTQTRKPKKPYKYIMRRELVERREAELPRHAPEEKEGNAMKIVIEKIGDNVGVSFIGKGPRIDRLMILAVALIETFVDSLIPDLTDEQLQQAADRFANIVKSAVIARYKTKPSERKEEFTGKEAAFLSKLFNL